jgi:phosphomevalonate kinase
MVNETTRQVKERKVGFSWTTFFWGFWVALFRSDWKWALIQFAIGVVTFSLSNLVFAFIYNKINMNDLIAEGYKPMDEFSYNVLVGKGFFIPDTVELTAWTPEKAA